VLLLAQTLPTIAQQTFKVLVSRGKVEAQYNDKSWDKLAIGSVLSASDKVRVSKDGYTSLTYVGTGKTFELKTPGTYKISDLAKQAAALSSGTAANLAGYVLREISSSGGGEYQQNMNLTASVDRALEPADKKNVVLPLGDGKPVKLYKGSYALLIGVSDYTDGWPKLPGVRRDIEEVKQSLEEHGFTTIVVWDPKHDQLDDAFRNFINTYCMDVENRVIIYFAGHGHTLRQSYGEEMGYIIPTDAPNPNRNAQGFISKAMAMQQLEVYAKQIQSKHALFLFDACFSGSIFSLSRAIPENITYKTAKPVRQFITSGSADETVPDKSVFREQFVSALRGEADVNKDGFVTGTELGEFLQDRVVNYSKNSQHPQYGKIRNPNLDKGDFVFNIRVAVSMKPDAAGNVQPVVTDVAVERQPSTMPSASYQRPRSPVAALGVRGGVHYAMMTYDNNASFAEQNPVAPMMTGFGFALGVSAFVPFDEQLGLMCNVQYDSRDAQVGLYKSLNEGDYFMFRVRQVVADVLVRYSVGDFWLAAGPTLTYHQSGSFTEKLVLGTISVDDTGIVESPSPLGFGARIGFGYDIPLSSSIILTPDMLFGIPITSSTMRYEYEGDVYETQSSHWTVQVGLALKFRL
jgi:hypothetical protein